MKKLKFGTNWSLGNLLRGLAFVTSDRPTKPVDAILFFTRASGDEGMLFELASETISAGQAKYIITNGGDGRGMGTVPGAAWPGKNAYAQEFQKLSVDPRIIHYSEPAGNTKIEAEEFLKVANGLGCKSAVILNHPHRLLRAGLHIIKELERKNQFLEIYFLCPTRTNWMEVTAGSQGKNPMPQIFHGDHEIGIIRKHSRWIGDKPPDIPSPQEFFDYIEKRDGQ